MSKKAPTSRPFARWPARDQHLWHAATRKGDFLDPDGKAAHWSDATRIQVEKGYGKWIFHLEAQGALPCRSNEDPMGRVDEDQLRAYLARLKQQGLASQTIASRITDLAEAIRVMQPDANTSILKQLAITMQQRAAPSRKKHAHKKSPASGPEATLHVRWSSLWSKLNAWINLSSPRFGQVSESSSQKRQLVVVTVRISDIF